MSRYPLHPCSSPDRRMVPFPPDVDEEASGVPPHIFTRQMNIEKVMVSLGYLAPRRQLGGLGIGRHVIDRALESGRLHRVRPGWVATRDAGQSEVVAVLAGGRLTGASALHSYGIWSGVDRRVHVQVPPNSHRVVHPPSTPLAAFTPPRFAATSVHTNWVHSAPSLPSAPAWRVGVTDALLQFARHEIEEQLAAAIESAVHTRLLMRSELPQLFTRMSRRSASIRRRLTFTAESGMETVFRLRMDDEGYALTQQVWIGRDRVDTVLGGWLVIELDGDEWHDPKADRQRTNRLIRAGYVVLRFGYSDVFERWSETLATIQVAVRMRSTSL